MLNRLALVARSVTFGALLLGTTLVPAIPAGAADLSQTPTGRAALFNIEAPTTGTMIHNGSIYAVSGWTAGTRDSGEK